MTERICIIKGCGRKHEARGWCGRHYQRWMKTGDPLKTSRERNLGTAEERFWLRVVKTEACWLWSASKYPRGYGVFSDGTRMQRAHRFAWELIKGPIPSGYVIDHICHNTSCVNPDHLRVATQKQNLENRSGAQRNSKSGVRGVSWNKRLNKWSARVMHHRKGYYLGMFADIESAEAAVIAKRNELFTHNHLDRATDSDPLQGPVICEGGTP